MWDNTLVTLPNGIADVSSTLMREYILRRFNKQQLKLEEAEGSDFNQIVGIGKRLDPETNIKEPISYFYPSYWRDLVKAFELFPIAKYFGLTPQTAMELPFDRWLNIRDSAIALKKKEPPDQESMVLQLIEAMVSTRGGGGG